MFGSFRNVMVSENEYKKIQHPMGGRSGWMRISTEYYCTIQALFSEVDFIYRFIERVPYFILALLSLYYAVVCVSQFVIHVFHSDSIGQPEMSLETPDYHGLCSARWIVLEKLGPPTAIAALSSQSLLRQSILNKFNTILTLVETTKPILQK